MKNKEVIFKILFVAMVVTLPFQKLLNLSFIPYGNYICVYFSIIAFIMAFLFRSKEESNLKKFAFKYFAIYILILSISFIVGFLSFDYPELFITAIGRNIEKFGTYLSKVDIDIFADSFAVIILGYKAVIRDGIILGIITFGTAFWITWFFKNKWHDAFVIIRKCTIIIFWFCIVYSLIEIFYVKGYALPTYILMKINLILYHIDFTGSVPWPPLLWGERMRSIFLESSYCAIFLASVLPIFLTYIFNQVLTKRMFIYYTLFTLIMFIIFGTNSKTAMVLISFLCLYILLVGLICRKFFKKSLFVLICVLVACVGYFCLLRTAYIIPAENPVVQWNIVKDITKKMNIQTNNIPCQQYGKEENVIQLINEALKSYTDKNINNLTNVNYGSNSSRYGITFAEIGVFGDNPMFGTGSNEFLQPYIYEHLPEFSDNEEVRRWTKFNWEHGVMSHKMPVLNDFTNKLAKFGLVGFSVFYFPLLYFLFKIFKNWKKMSFIDKQYICALLAGLCCIFIGCMAGPLNLFFTYWVFLGVLGAIAFTDYDKDNNVE